MGPVAPVLGTGPASTGTPWARRWPSTRSSGVVVTRHRSADPRVGRRAWSATVRARWSMRSIFTMRPQPLACLCAGQDKLVAALGATARARHVQTEGVAVFVQVIQGQVDDAAKVRAAMDRWAEELAPGAEGWLGSTAGVTEDGRFIALARFESEEAARRNSDRPEQDRWWSETSQLFTGEASFRDSDDVTLDLAGDPDDAGFVQVIQGQGTDPDRARELMAEDSSEWADFRPEIIGSVAVGHDGGAYTMAMYFTSEAEAREGERKELPPKLKAQMDEMAALSVGVPDFFDIKQPWLYSPR